MKNRTFLAPQMFLIHQIGTAALLTMLLLMMAFQVQAKVAGEQSQVIDLAKLTDNNELTSAMLASPKNSAMLHLIDAIRFNDWRSITKDTANAPRQHTTLWLTATLHNSGAQTLTRWLVVEPWRVNRVEAFFINPVTEKQLAYTVTGLDIPLQDRPVSNGKTVVPVTLDPGETQQLYLKIYSDSLPFISITSWEPIAYALSIQDDRIFQIALLASILTLLVLLALQFNASLMLTGIWLLVAFIFETEKDGFFSNYLLSSLVNYSANLRISAWVFTEQLFLTTSVFLLGLNRYRGWRIWIMLSGSLAVVVAGLTFVLDGASIRQLGIWVTGLYACSWLLMIAPALRIERNQQVTLLLLLSIYWLVSTFLLLGYKFNFYYTSAFAGSRVYVEIAVALALALIVTYSWQHKRQLRLASLALNAQQTENQERLELAVAHRTQDLNMALESAKKASMAKANFLDQISHDLRAPLTAILGYAQLQAAGVVDIKKTNQIIQDRAGYMKDLIDSLVDYTHDLSAERDGLSDIYLIAFIDNLANQVHLLANHRANRFHVNIETELPTVIRCNPIQLQRILLNLLDNATKYTAEGEISLAVSLSSTPSEQQLIFRVSDTGQGIAPAHLEKIYTPFFQGADSHPGSGLGLSICFELAAQMGGTLALSSELGVGTQASFTLLYLAGNEQQAQLLLSVAQDLLPLFDAQGQLAWIIEDSQPIAELLDAQLSEMGFDVQRALSAEDFIDHIKDDNRAPAVIMTDYQLAGATGVVVLQAARTHWPEVPVILLSAHQVSAAAHLGFSATLTKPIDLLALRLELAKHCHLQEIH